MIFEFSHHDFLIITALLPLTGKACRQSSRIRATNSYVSHENGQVSFDSASQRTVQIYIVRRETGLEILISNMAVVICYLFFLNRVVDFDCKVSFNTATVSLQEKSSKYFDFFRPLNRYVIVCSLKQFNLRNNCRRACKTCSNTSQIFAASSKT